MIKKIQFLYFPDSLKVLKLNGKVEMCLEYTIYRIDRIYQCELYFVSSR